MSKYNIKDLFSTFFINGDMISKDELKTLRRFMKTMKKNAALRRENIISSRAISIVSSINSNGIFNQGTQYVDAQYHGRGRCSLPMG